MNPILNMLMNSAGDSGAVEQFGRQFGLSGEQTSGALGQLVPALMSGLQGNMSQEGGLTALLRALNDEHHGQYLDRPELLEQEDTTADGNAILGHIFGSKDVSRSIAVQASEQTGIDAGTLKRMLPVVATLVMGGLSKYASGASGSLGAPANLLTSLLNQNRSGSILDDGAGTLGSFLGRR